MLTINSSCLTLHHLKWFTFYTLKCSDNFWHFLNNIFSLILSRQAIKLSCYRVPFLCSQKCVLFLWNGPRLDLRNQSDWTFLYVKTCCCFSLTALTLFIDPIIKIALDKLSNGTIDNFILPSPTSSKRKPTFLKCFGSANHRSTFGMVRKLRHIYP